MIGRRLKIICWACAISLIVINAYLLHSQLANIQAGESSPAYYVFGGELLGTFVLVLGVAVFCGYLVLMATAVQSELKAFLRYIRSPWILWRATNYRR